MRDRESIADYLVTPLPKIRGAIYLKMSPDLGICNGLGLLAGTSETSTRAYSVIDCAGRAIMEANNNEEDIRILDRENRMSRARRLGILKDYEEEVRERMGHPIC